MSDNNRLPKDLLATAAALFEGAVTREAFPAFVASIDRADTADALAWMVARHKRPYNDANVTTGSWFNAATICSGLGDEESDIPEDIFSRLRGGRQNANHRTYTHYAEAVAAFIDAWAERRAGWDPDGD